MDLSKRIRATMDAAGVDAIELAARLNRAGCDVAYNSVYQWWLGRRTPRAEMIPHIARALECTLDELYGTEPGEPEPESDQPRAVVWG